MDAFPTGLALPIISVFFVLSLLVLYRYRYCKVFTVNNTVKKEVDESCGESYSSQGKFLMDILQVRILKSSCAFLKKVLIAVVRYHAAAPG